MDSQQFFSTKDAARIVGVSAETIRRWERLGVIVFRRSWTKRRRISEDDIARLRALAGHADGKGRD